MMMLDYIPDGAPDFPLLRLSGFTDSDAQELHVAVSSLASGAIDRVDTHGLHIVEARRGARLALVRWRREEMVVRNAECDIEWRGGAPHWAEVAGLIQPFTDGQGGFQWLAGPPSPVAVLLSRSGDW